MLINDAETLAEVEAAFAAYEAALMANDLTTLDALFWDSPLTIRFGPGQNLYGFEAIAAFRVGRVGGSPQRAISNTVITTFGKDFATANTEFQRIGAPRPGRQTQTWVRTDSGWRVVSAHVSFLGDGS
ncbi:MAG: oxalurate catabolism protein HpxZ [Caulobacterales bacterium]